jgi:raffinose/stachyose/melibiose transport system permease protein
MKKARGGILGTILILFSIAWLSPIYIVLVNSFKSRSEMYANVLALPEQLTWKYYTEAFAKMNFGTSFLNSLILTVASIFLIVVLSSMAAWMLARTGGKLSYILFGVFIATMLIPFQTIMMPLMQVMSWIGKNTIFQMLNSRGGLIYMYIGFGASMAIFLYHGFVKTIPVSIEEAATIDGGNKWNIFWRVVFPILKPTTVTVIILDVIWIWNDYLLPSLTLTARDLRTIPLSTAKFFGQYQNEWNMAMAALAMTILPVVLLDIFAQKYIIKGVAAGSVKG